MLEFRLYYDENGELLFYTCEKPEGKYIIIDTQTYAECRSDIKIIDGKIVKKNNSSILRKLVPAEKGLGIYSGIKCASIDVNIIAQNTLDFIVWNTKTYEN